ncbi:MAG TPA: ankyrin repeat domain-containing protein [Burkholderiales bacterium]|nr:ankyrin repeat domain-containing protein [Burkholderiales bacterium]
MTFETRFFALLFALILVIPATACAQSREQKISQVMRAMDAIDFPMMRKEVLPRHVVAKTTAELEQVGKRLELGAEWKPGNAYWDRAEAAMRKDLQGGMSRRTAGDRQQDANVRESLAELSDAQLDEVLHLYNSDVFRKSIRMADASLTARALAFTGEGQDDAKLARTLESLKREMELNKLTPQEEQRLDKMMQSPAMQLLARGRSADALSALSDPSSLLQPALMQATVDQVGALIALFRGSQVKGNPGTAPAAAGTVEKAELDRGLLDAVKKVNIARVRELLEAGADIETRDQRPNEGETPLHHAARTGNVELAKLLVAKGANINVAGPSGFVPLHVAAGLNRRAMAEYLLAAGANPNAMEVVGTPLHVATLQGHAAMVSLLLAKGADPNARRPRDGYTPLHVLSQIGQYYAAHGEIIETLVRSGAEINAKSTDGRTPLDGAHQNAIAPLQNQGAVRSPRP